MDIIVKEKLVARYVKAVIAAAAAALCAGCGGGGGGSVVLVPPTVVSTALSRYLVPSTGGSVTISAQVTGDGISQVRASVALPGGGTANVVMSGSAGSYSGTYTAPANTTNSILTYTVTVRATNTNGAYDDGDSRAFGVLPAEEPPPPPGP